MTGFGRAERRTEALTIRVEVRSVNARGLKVTLRTPSLLEPHQAELEKRVKSRCERGTITAFFSIDREQARAPARIDENVLAEYLRQAWSMPPDYWPNMRGISRSNWHAGIGNCPNAANRPKSLHNRKTLTTRLAGTSCNRSHCYSMHR